MQKFCLSVAKVQFEAAQLNVWLRGGITVGDVHIAPDKNEAIGKGIVKAYELEAKYAVYPRIILDGSLINEDGCANTDDFTKKINGESGGHNTVFSWVNRHVSSQLNRDVPLFLDYLAPTIYDRGRRDRIVQLVQKNLLVESLEHFPKYDWVRRYVMDMYLGGNRYGLDVHDYQGMIESYNTLNGM